jgi:hypothetical protein
MSPLDQRAERLSDRFVVAGREASETGERQLHVVESQRPALSQEQAEPAASRRVVTVRRLRSEQRAEVERSPTRGISRIAVSA